ncbi:MAG TPA: hypothetical protein VKE96_10765 [Vicinamibacterales bacterium]|nr:hypothetical protein [Vicinamibacterales bacterium]
MTETLPAGAGTARVDILTARVRAATAGELVAFLPYTVLVTALVSVSLVITKHALTPSFAYAPTVSGIAGAAVAAALLVGLVARRQRTVSPQAADPHAGWAPWIVALHVGVLLLIVPVLLLTKSVPEDDIPGWTFGFLNKRWLSGLYDVAVATVLVVPLAVARWRTPTAVWSSTSVDQLSARRHLSWLLGACAAAALVWYVAGPPWNIDRHHRAVDFHEQALLGPLQAMAKGYLPYIGPASTQYGPGCQLLLYAAMVRLGRFDIVGFRTACAALNFLALLALAIAAGRSMTAIGAAAVVVLSLAYSPFAFFFTFQDGTFGGFYGWGFALRYLAPVIVVPALGHWLVAGEDSKSWRIVALGAVWGAGAWLAQENLSTTVVSAGLLFLTLWLTSTIELRNVVAAVRNLVLGFGCAIAPVLVWYAWRGELGTFLHNYFVVPRAVAAGYSNMWWPIGDAARPDRFSYYFTAPFALALGVCALWRLPDFRPAAPLDWRRVRLFAYIAVLVACYQTALFRSDYAHVMNTMIALPFVLILGLVELPRWLASTPRAKAAVAVLFVALSLGVYPTLATQRWAATLSWPLSRFRSTARVEATSPAGGDVALQRATPLLADEPEFAGGTALPMRTFLAFAADIHNIVGSRRTLVVDLGDRAWTGALYFFADLTPAAYPFDRETMTLNAVVRSQVAADIAVHPERYDCVIGTSLDDQAAVAFLRTHPNAIRLSRMLPAKDGSDATRVHILLVDRPA